LKEDLSVCDVTVVAITILIDISAWQDCAFLRQNMAELSGAEWYNRRVQGAARAEVGIHQRGRRKEKKKKEKNNIVNSFVSENTSYFFFLPGCCLNSARSSSSA